MKSDKWSLKINFTLFLHFEGIEEEFPHFRIEALFTLKIRSSEKWGGGVTIAVPNWAVNLTHIYLQDPMKRNLMFLDTITIGLQNCMYQLNNTQSFNYIETLRTHSKELICADNVWDDADKICYASRGEFIFIYIIFLFFC